MVLVCYWSHWLDSKAAFVPAPDLTLWQKLAKLGSGEVSFNHHICGKSSCAGHCGSNWKVSSTSVAREVWDVFSHRKTATAGQREGQLKKNTAFSPQCWLWSEHILRHKGVDVVSHCIRSTTCSYINQLETKKNNTVHVSRATVRAGRGHNWIPVFVSVHKNERGNYLVTDSCLISLQYMVICACSAGEQMTHFPMTYCSTWLFTRPDFWVKHSEHWINAELLAYFEPDLFFTGPTLRKFNIPM